MHVIGVIGGIASGKSAVTRMFESLGAYRVDADHLGHLVLADPDIQAQLIERWGRMIMRDGQVDRSAIAQIVFAPQNQRELEFLEAVTHRRIEAKVDQQLEAARTAGYPAVVLDAALLIKSGWDRFCDWIVFVDASEAIRLQRVQQRGWGATELQEREAAQRPLSEKRQRAHFVVDNSGAPDATRRQVRDVWQRLMTNGSSTLGEQPRT